MIKNSEATTGNVLEGKNKVPAITPVFETVSAEPTGDKGVQIVKVESILQGCVYEDVETPPKKVYTLAPGLNPVA